MPQKDDENMLTTTTFQLTRRSLDELERQIVGQRNQAGRKITKRAVFQHLIDRFCGDKRFRDKVLKELQKTDSSIDD